MLGACLLQRYLCIGQRQLLKVMDLVREWIMVVLGHAGLEQMKQDLGILRIVLVPGVMHGFAGSRHSERGDQLQMETFSQQEMCQWPVVVPGGFEDDAHRVLQVMKKVSKQSELG